MAIFERGALDTVVTGQQGNNPCGDGGVPYNADSIGKVEESIDNFRPDYERALKVPGGTRLVIELKNSNSKGQIALFCVRAEEANDGNTQKEHTTQQTDAINPDPMYWPRLGLEGLVIAVAVVAWVGTLLVLRKIRSEKIKMQAYAKTAKGDLAAAEIERKKQQKAEIEARKASELAKANSARNAATGEFLRSALIPAADSLLDIKGSLQAKKAALIGLINSTLSRPSQVSPADAARLVNDLKGMADEFAVLADQVNDTANGFVNRAKKF